MTTTYRNFKKSLIFCFKIFEFLCVTECELVYRWTCAHGMNSCLFHSGTLLILLKQFMSFVEML